MNKNKTNEFVTSLDELWTDTSSDIPIPDEKKSADVGDHPIEKENTYVAFEVDNLPDQEKYNETPEQLLSKLPFNRFIEKVDISRRTCNAVLAGIDEDLIDFSSAGDYWNSTSKKKNELFKLEGFGKKGKTEIDESIQNLLNNPDQLRRIAISESKKSYVVASESKDSYLSFSNDGHMFLSEIPKRLKELVTEKQHIVLRKRLIHGETLEKVGKEIDVTRERVRQIEKKALNNVNRLLELEIQCFIARLGSLLLDAGGILNFQECIQEFPELEEYEFLVLFSAFHCNRDDQYKLKDGFVWKKEVYDSQGWIEQQIRSVFLASQWPVSITSMAVLLNDIPRPYIEHYLKERYLATIKDGIVVTTEKLGKQEQLTFALRYIGESAHLEKIRDTAISMFGKSGSLHSIESNLARRDDVLITDSRTFCLYETLGMSDDSLDEIRDTAYSYLVDLGDYVRANILCDDLFHQKKYDGVLVTPFKLLGILQDDPRYITKPGLIIGLQEFGDTWQMRDAIEDIVRRYAPIHTREVLQHLPENRMVPEVTVSGVLREHPAFIRTGPGIYDTIERVFGSKAQQDSLLTQINNELARQPETESSLYERLVQGKLQSVNHFAFSTLLKRNFNQDNGTGKFHSN